MYLTLISGDALKPHRLHPGGGSGLSLRHPRKELCFHGVKRGAGEIAGPVREGITTQRVTDDSCTKVSYFSKVKFLCMDEPQNQVLFNSAHICLL